MYSTKISFILSVTWLLFGVDMFEDILLLEDGYNALPDVLLQFVNVDDEGSYAFF